MKHSAMLKVVPTLFLAVLAILVFLVVVPKDAIRLPSTLTPNLNPAVPPPGACDADRIRAHRELNPSISKLPALFKEPLPTVYMSLENSVHFKLDSDIAIQEWENGTLPRHTTISLPVHGRQKTAVFTTSMFHQIRCLNIIRASVVAFRSDRTKPSPLTRHCMNYLRQMVLCRGDVTLESGRHPVGPRTVVSDITHVCRDWSVVWKEMDFQ